MAEGSRQIRLMTFRVGGDSFVLDIMSIRQIIAWGGVTRVPQAPDFIEGIIVLRNEVIPVVDLRARLRPDLPPLDRIPLILIVEGEAGTIGFKVDEVRRIITVESDSILPAPAIVRGLRGELFIGVVPEGEDVHLLLDVETVLSPDEKKELMSAELKPAETELPLED
ncbi:MAG TPA: chemotaxis protein CheW [Thermoanaerobaculia bacterium]|nr:chemotaxis protein CheW [Thermoanaerobaculia bacterium]